MSLFSLLRKPAWEHQDPSRRAAAVASEAHPDLIAKLPELVRHDADAGVRLAALRRITDIGLLGDRMRNDDDTSLRGVARQRYLQRLLDPEVALTERERFVRVEDDAEILASIAQQAAESELRRVALERSTRTGLLLDRCVSDPDPEIRRWLLDRFDDVDSLDRIAERVRRTDKLLARTARERAQAARLAVGDPDTVRARALAICDELDGLRRTAAPDAATVRATLAQEWLRLKDHLDGAMEQRVDGYFIALDTALAPPAIPEPELKSDADADAEAVTVAEIPTTPAREPDIALTALLAELEARLGKLNLGTLESLEKRWKKRLSNIGPLLPEEEEQEQRFRDKAESVRQRFEARAQQQRAALDRLPGLVDEIEAAIAAGKVSVARDLQRRIDVDRNILREQFPRSLGSRLGNAARELERLGEWQHWSNNKARLSLINEAEALATSGLHPDAMASKVKEHQAEWQRLDEVDGRASDTQGHPLARRFHAACRRSLAPARPYFEKRREIRGERREEIEAFLDDLDGRLSESLPIRELLVARRQITDRLRVGDELDPGARRELSRRLREALDRVKTAIEATEVEGEAAKRKLLANLRRDLMHADLANALPIARAAQSTWKTLPRAARKTDDALWAELRELVDPWFKQADEKQREHRAAETASAAQARAILDELTQLAKADDEILMQAESRLAELQARWQTLAEAQREAQEPAPLATEGRRPRPQRRPERGAMDERAFDRAVQQVRDAHTRLLDGVRRSEYTLLIEAGTVCDQIDALPEDATDEQRTALIEQLDGLGLANDVRARLQGRLDASADTVEPGLGARAEELTLVAELALGIDSADADREMRRRLQIERLSRHLSDGAGQTEDLRELLLEYVALSGVTPQQRSMLAARWQAIVVAMARE